MKSFILQFSATSLLFLHYDFKTSHYSFFSFVALAAETLCAIYVYFEAAGMAMATECIATGWVFRELNPGGAEISLSLQTSPGAHCLL
jgi:hypothetical protein